MKKRIFCIALALVMTLALAAPAFAEDAEPTPAPEYRLASITDEEGSTFTFTYGQGGWLPTAEYLQDVEYVVASYDAAGRVISFEYVADGYFFDRGQAYEYDENGNLLMSKFYGEEYLGNTISTWEVSRVYTYDENGNRSSLVLTSISGGETFIGTYEYTCDDAGNIIFTKRYQNGEPEAEVQSTYDDAGNLLHQEVTFTDGSVNVTEYTYDDAGDLLRQETTSSDGTVSTKEYTHDYDDAGNLLRSEVFTDGVTDYAYEYTYDEAGNMLSETYYDDGEKYREMTYIYTPLQTFLIERYPDESQMSFYLCDSVGTKIFDMHFLTDYYNGIRDIGELQFTYDDNGYITQIDSDNGLSVTFTYEPVA